MARGKKTGGRDFLPGNPGRPEGAKDIVPRSAAAAIRGLFARFGNDTALMAKVMEEGLTARAPISLGYYKLLIENNIGLPEQNVNVQTTVIHEHRASTSA